MAVEAKRTITFPCPKCSCIQKHELRPALMERDVAVAVCMECESENGRVGDYKDDE